MKRTLAIYILLLICGLSYSQTISVSSFKLLDSDLTANTAGTMEQDQNGETAALIKVVTTQTGFTFDGGSMGIVKTIQKPSEIWMYIPRGSKKITISHPQLGLLRDYYYPISIEAARTYEMVLTTGVVQTIVKQTANSQYIVLKVSPNNAIVELDNEVLTNSNGIAQKFVKLGTYDYRVQAPNYHTAAGKVTVDDPDNKKVVEISLLPAFGWVELLGNEENKDAQVYIDNALVGTIPFKSQELPSGEHHIRVVKPMYDSYSQAINITDNKTTQITPQLKADFSVVTINVDINADIYVNEEKKGTGSWTGNLASGTYIMEAKKDGHRSTLANIEVSANQKSQTVQLQSPVPIYGSLNITSTPSEADVYIDGISLGRTPLFIPKALIGQRNIVLTHKGYDDYKSAINILEGGTATLNVKMTDENLILVNLSSNASNATVYIDGEEYGKVSEKYRLTAGNHRIKLVADGFQDVEKDVVVTTSSPKYSFEQYIKMTPLKVTFHSDLPNSYISIDNKNFEYCGYTVGEKFELSKGIHTITARHEGKRKFKTDINVVRGDEVFLVSFSKRTIFSPEINKEEFDLQMSKIDEELKEYVIKQAKKNKIEAWEKITLTSFPSEVSGMVMLGDVTQKYNNLTAFESLNRKNYERCIKRMKKAAAKLGATKILLGTPYQGGLLNSFCIMPATAYK